MFRCQSLRKKIYLLGFNFVRMINIVSRLGSLCGSDKPDHFNLNYLSVLVYLILTIFFCKVSWRANALLKTFNKIIAIHNIFGAITHLHKTNAFIKLLEDEVILDIQRLTTYDIIFSHYYLHIWEILI